MPAPRRATLQRVLIPSLLLVMSPWAWAQGLPAPHARDGVAPIATEDLAQAAPGQVAASGEVQAGVAAVLVATLAERFSSTMLDLRLDPATVDVEGPREHVVHGIGYVRFTDGAGADEGSDEWLAFRYRSRYDPLFASAGYPEIVLGAGGEGEGERFVPNDALLLGELEARVATELEALPGAGRVFLQLDDISSTQSGERFVRIQAQGLADFGPGGSTDALIDALYDLGSGAWLSIEHALGPNVRAHEDGATAGP
ncbi:hypothetical protein WCE39_05230 [Luteimonas sp. MJ174]|uniref:hypothetical protein n=1 Tax=Luteimonas sp. MJ174 TaxID=3129237 RepID=UPI0031BB87C2